jgi:hypothetical protein
MNELAEKQLHRVVPGVFDDFSYLVDTNIVAWNDREILNIKIRDGEAVEVELHFESPGVIYV